MKTGMMPNLIMTLSQHAALAQEVADADVKFKALSFLLRCKRDLVNLTMLVSTGRLPEAVEACKELDVFLESFPAPLNDATISSELKVNAERLHCFILY